jgi:hypothetical protein
MDGSGAAEVSILSLESLEIGDKVHNLIRIELELGHHGMACPNSLSKCFGKIIDRVTQMQFAERRREFLRALSRL